jgi:type II secretory pathway pseudopilin PulG
MSGKSRKYAGFLITEVTVAMIVMGIILAGLALTLNVMARFNRYQLTRQRCLAAAQAQLDCIAATGKPINNADFERLWPSLSVAIYTSRGIGQWQGMELVRITTTGKSFNKQVKVEQYRYLRP